MDTTTLILISAVTVIALALVAGAIFFAPQIAARNKLRRRIGLVSGDASEIAASSGSGFRLGGRKRDIQTRLKEAEQEKNKSESRLVQYRMALRRAGMNISVQRYGLMCLGISLVTCIAYLFLPYPRFAALPIALTVGFGIPTFYVKFRIQRRINRFTARFADSVDIIVRGIRSGLPVGECLNIIAREAPDPINGIFFEIVEATKLGLPLDQGLARAAEQMPTAEMKFFNIVLSIQQQTGGNLADTLSNLSGILRDRKKLKDKIQALSSEAKSSAAIIGSLPILVTLALWFMSPKYIGLLFSSQTGQLAVMGGLVWMALGIFVMRQMINFEI